MRCDGSQDSSNPAQANITVTAKVTKAGRKMLKNAKSLNSTLVATVPGGGQRSGGLKLVR